MFALVPVTAFRFLPSACRALSGAALVISAMAGPALASDFFAGKTIKLVVSASAGGGYDAYTRLLGRHIGRHIPGNPSIVVLNMPGGGGLTSARYIYSVAAKDGTEIGQVRASNMLDSVLGIRGGQIDPARFEWIGSMASDTDVCVFSKASGIRTFKDLLNKPTTIGGTGRGAQAFSFPNAINNVLGTRMKIILGYKGTPDRVIAMERGELMGSCGINASTFLSVLGQQYEKGTLVPVVQSGLTPNPVLKDVPLTLSFTQTAEQHDILEGVFSQMQIANAYAGPPDIPKDRVTTLRAAFDKTMADRRFLSEASRARIPISPTNGADAAQVIEKMTSMSPTLKRKVRSAIEE